MLKCGRSLVLDGHISTAKRTTTLSKTEVLFCYILPTVRILCKIRNQCKYDKHYIMITLCPAIGQGLLQREVKAKGICKFKFSVGREINCVF